MGETKGKEILAKGIPKKSRKREIFKKNRINPFPMVF
jgi:hypothetical protein